MAKIKKKKATKVKTKREINNRFSNRHRLTESYTGLILGAIAVLIAGILLLSFAKIHRNIQTSSVKDSSRIEDQNSNTSSTYTVNSGDDLWNISEKIYHDGFKWIEIAKANKLENPGLIHVGNKLFVPTVDPSISEPLVSAPETVIPVGVNTVATITKNNSIIGNTYTVEPGDNLWNIAVRAYGDGFRYQDIVKANSLENPSLIFSGNVLQIPR